MNIFSTDLLIIGSGPASLMAALTSQDKREVTIVERDSKDFKLAKRILISGNGRANFFNEDLLSLNIDDEYKFLISDEKNNYSIYVFNSFFC